VAEADNQIEKKLVHGLRKSETRAFDGIYNLYSRRVYHFAFSFLKNKSDSEEIVQEVFLRLWKHRKKIDEYYSFKAFLFTISYNIIIDKFRERIKEKKYYDFLKTHVKTSDTDTDKKVEYSDLERLYKSAVDLLPPRRKQIYHMSRVEGLTYKDIAQRLNISPKTVENQIATTLKFLREKLGHESILSVLFYYLFI
jgi:RNA polymerase sigma-70 factor (ECF subfamily)